MYTDYSKFSEIYDDCGASEYSLDMGSSIIRFFDNECEEAESGRVRKHLDICCGTGELCGFFAGQGYDSVGVDISPDMLSKARENYPGIPFFKGDVTLPFEESAEGADGRTLRAQGDCDLVTCVDDAINHILDPEAVKGLIENAYRSLRGGGLFVFDMVDPDFLEFYEPYPVYVGDDYSLIYEIKKKGEKMIINHMRCLGDGKMLWQASISEYMYSCEEMTEYLKAAGFEVVFCDKDFYDEKSLIKWKYVCKKSE